MALTGGTSMSVGVEWPRMTQAAITVRPVPSATDIRTGSPGGEQEAESAGKDITDRVDNAVAAVAEGDGRHAIVIDDEVGVLEDLPGHRERRRQRQPRRQQPGSVRSEPGQVEPETVQDVREGVPIGEVLRVPRAPHDAVPDLYIAAGAPRLASHREEHDH